MKHRRIRRERNYHANYYYFTGELCRAAGLRNKGWLSVSEREKKKEYLKEIKYILIRKKDVKERIRQLKINWQCPGSMKPSMTQSSSGGIRDTSNYSTALEELEEELKKLNEELSQAEAVRIRAINELPHKYASILEKRYIYRKEFEEIGKEIGYEKSNVYELHRKALDMFQIPK